MALYDVYWDTYMGCDGGDGDSYSTMRTGAHFIGTTNAKSEKQAINNVRYRHRNKSLPLDTSEFLESWGEWRAVIKEDK